MCEVISLTDYKANKAMTDRMKVYAYVLSARSRVEPDKTKFQRLMDDLNRK